MISNHSTNASNMPLSRLLLPAVHRHKMTLHVVSIGTDLLGTPWYRATIAVSGCGVPFEASFVTTKVFLTCKVLVT